MVGALRFWLGIVPILAQAEARVQPFHRFSLWILHARLQLFGALGEKRSIRFIEILNGRARLSERAGVGQASQQHQEPHWRCAELLNVPND